jgi:hypothetical protein
MSPTRGMTALALAVVVLVGGCSTIERGRPEPTPLDFPGMTGELARSGVQVDSWKSGDAGCSDTTLAPTAISFLASGAGVSTPTPVRVYIFNDRAAWERRHADVEICVAEWATDPATFELVDASPYVLAGQGPWPASFRTAIEAALARAAGNGG